MPSCPSVACCIIFIQTWYFAGDDLEDIDSSCTVSSTPVLRVETIYVISTTLASKSSFFSKVILMMYRNAFVIQSVADLFDELHAC